MGRGCVGFFGFLGERGREALQGENLLPLHAARPGEEDGKQCYQNDTVCNSFFNEH